MGLRLQLLTSLQWRPRDGVQKVRGRVMSRLGHGVRSCLRELFQGSADKRLEGGAGSQAIAQNKWMLQKLFRVRTILMEAHVINVARPRSCDEAKVARRDEGRVTR